MATKPIDTFILNSVDLFKVNPSQSVISITYQPPKVTVSSSSSSSSASSQKKKTNLPSITFKTNNPHLASTYKYTTNKNKDVSRILNSIGPNGVSIIPNGILKRQINSKSNNQKNKKKKIALITGLTTLLINNKIPQFIENNNNTTTSTSTSSTSTNKDSKKKKNKNKNKNKR